MSRATMRAALVEYLRGGCLGPGASVPGVTKVYSAQPVFIDGSVFKLYQNLGSGSVLFLHFPDKGESRAADPAASVSTEVVGWKQVDYQVAVVVLYQYLIKTGSQAADLDGDEWVEPLDATLDGLEALLRADPTAGTGPDGDGSGDVFEMAQSPGDLTLPQDLPRRGPGGIQSWQAIHLTATEMIRA
ncbi:MAG TPA: hypothetical protein VN088_19060 [Nocardioides sp.]|nr:hypothetical protein [Nocardioides sp.]